MSLWAMLTYFMQCELYHWIDVLNRFDDILERAAVQKDESSATKGETATSQTDSIFLCPRLNDKLVS